MAEIIGVVASGMTIAGLFKICVEAFDLIQTGRHQELDLKKLTLRLNIEKCRLYTWGQAMGLTESTSRDRQRPLDQCQFRDLVTETLEIIFQLFNNTHRIKDAYGCRRYTEQDGSQLRPVEAEEAGPVEYLATSFTNFKIGGNKRKRSSNILQKGRWVVHDRKKFNGLITEVKDLIDGLQGITKSFATVADQTCLMRKGICNIKNIETLGLVSEVCEVDHPEFSDAASMIADTISMATTARNGIATWTDSIDVGTASDLGSIDLESMTVTELKHRLWELLQERQSTDPGDSTVGNTEAEDMAPVHGRIKDGRVQLQHATNLVNRIKNRYTRQPHIFKLFVTLLQLFREESVPIETIDLQLTTLLKDAPDLLKELKRFDSQPYLLSLSEARAKVLDIEYSKNVQGSYFLQCASTNSPDHHIPHMLYRTQGHRLTEEERALRLSSIRRVSGARSAFVTTDCD